MDLAHLPFVGFRLGGLSVELTMLALASALGIVQLLLYARSTNSQRGLKWNLSARDEPGAPVGKGAARLERAYRNFMETFPFFAAAVIVAALAGKHGALTLWGSQIYLAARIVYLPLYGFGVPGLRTLVWLIAMIGIVMVLAALFLPT
jgi:uncharacterized MAPEG superfamily protein